MFILNRSEIGREEFTCIHTTPLYSLLQMGGSSYERNFDLNKKNDIQHHT
jgi:hypothetical protein